MVDAVLLEIEGVLFDTGALRRSALAEALREHGFATDAPKLEHDDVALDLVRVTAERIFGRRLSAGGIALTPGALDFVRESASQARVAIVTRARRSEAEAMLGMAAIGDLVSIAVTRDDVLDGKPAPEAYRAAIARLSRQRRVDERSILSIEDALPGIRGAHAAGVRCVAVGPLPAHVALEADAYVESIEGHSARTLELLSRPGRERVQ